MMKTVSGFLTSAAMMLALAVGGVGPALAQSKPDSEALIDAIEEQRANDAIGLINKRGRAIVNIRGYAGSTPLIVAMRKRAPLYVNFLLQNGASPDLGDKQGDTALIVAARLGYLEGITSMLAARASVDAANRQGETALIVAVQGRHVQLVRRLLEAGASATKTDNASGLSARDYAVRDRRSGELLRLIDGARPKPRPVFVAGPVIE